VTTRGRNTRPRVKAGTTGQAKEERRRKFVEAMILNGDNITQSAIDAGYKRHAAAQQGSRLLKEAKTQALLAARRAELQQKLELTTERTLAEVARLAYHDPRSLFNEDGTTKPIHQLDADSAAAIAGVEVTHEYVGKGESRKLVATTTKYKMADKNAALDKAMKHQGLYKADNLQRNPLEGLPRETLKAIVEKLSGQAGPRLAR
jgi:phage terminase small subunit